MAMRSVRLTRSAMFSSSGNETASANPAAWSLSFPGWFALPLAFNLWTNVIVIVHQKNPNRPVLGARAGTGQGGKLVKIEGRPKVPVGGSTGRDGGHAASNCGKPVSSLAGGGGGDGGASPDGRLAALLPVHLLQKSLFVASQVHRGCRVRLLEHPPLRRLGGQRLQGPLPRQHQTLQSRRIADP